MIATNSMSAPPQGHAAHDEDDDAGRYAPQADGGGGSAGRFVVAGAGPAGLTAAYDASKRGLDPLVFEKSHTVGGISRTETYKGYGFDMGGHRFFTKSPEVQQVWQELLGGEFLTRPRLSRIFYDGKFYNYPLKPLDAMRNLGIYESAFLTASYLRWKVFPFKQEENFEQWVVNRFGRRLYRTFFKTYTEKVWGMSTKELRADWAAQRIKNLSLSKAVLGGIFKPKHGKVTSLIEKFQYPRRGPGMLWQRCADRIEEKGGEVRMNVGVEKIHRDGHRVTAVTDTDGRRVEVDKMINSMPLGEFVRRLDPPPPLEVTEAALQLRYRDFLTVCLIVDDPEPFPDNWIYIHDPVVQVGRIQNFKNWSPDMVPEAERATRTSLGLEYFCNAGDALWSMTDEELVKLAGREIAKIGLVPEDKVVDGVVFRVPKSYPVYDEAYAEHVKTIRGFVDAFANCRTVGRNGLHRYNNQDHSMLTGLYAVRSLIDGETHDLWEVNADTEYHEEVKSGRRKRGQVGRNVNPDNDPTDASPAAARRRVAAGA